MSKLVSRVAVLIPVMLSACSPVPDTFATREAAETAAGIDTDEPPRLAGTAQSEVKEPGEPIARGQADVSGLTLAQIDVMFTAALAQAKPFAEHQAVCLSLATDGGGWRRDPPTRTLESLADLTDLPVLPGSRCAFDVFPYVIGTKERAMLYSVIVEPRKPSAPVRFWAHATFGNLGANGAQFILRRGPDGWYASPTGVQSIS